MTMTTLTNRVYLVVVAAGSSTRMGGLKKEYLPLEEGTVLSRAVRSFLEAYPITKIAIAIPKGGQRQAEEALFTDSKLKQLSANIPLILVEGGKTRQESVLNALSAIADKTETKVRSSVVISVNKSY